jgi:uncharacterized membrane protein
MHIARRCSVNSKAASDLASKYLRRSWDVLTERERKVLVAVIERLHVSRPIHREMQEDLSLGQRVADHVASFGGSWPFIGLFFVFILGWMGVNTLMLMRPYDPYPYILLNLILSCLAAIQAPVILMSQSRQADRDRQQAAHDYEVNLKAEIEIMQLHEKIELLKIQELTEIVAQQKVHTAMLEALLAK